MSIWHTLNRPMDFSKFSRENKLPSLATRVSLFFSALCAVVYIGFDDIRGPGNKHTISTSLCINVCQSLGQMNRV